MPDRPDDIDLQALLPDPMQLQAMIEGWLAEDIGRGDITTKFLIPRAARAKFALRTREDIVVCGIDIAAMIFRTVEPECEVEVLAWDGSKVAADGELARVSGNAQGLLTAERTAINLLQFLTGIATDTRKYVDLVSGTGATLIDTRKTVPGHRDLSKYATRVGGARNHRMRLDDGILMKDNHVVVAGGIAAAVAKAKALTPSLTKIQIECDTLDQVGEAVEAGADSILLDNMSAADMKRAVELVAGRCELEASGGINLETVAEKASSGVDFISVGRITHSAPAADIGLDATIDV